MAIVLTYEITLDDSEQMTVPFYIRSAGLMRLMARTLEGDQAAHSGSEGFSVGKSFECIKLVKKETR